MNQNTYILRMNPGKINKIEENRNENRISIGWSSIGNDLLDANLFRYEFREKIHIHFQYPNYRASGNADIQLIDGETFASLLIDNGLDIL